MKMIPFTDIDEHNNLACSQCVWIFIAQLVEHYSGRLRPVSFRSDIVEENKQVSEREIACLVET